MGYYTTPELEEKAKVTNKIIDSVQNKDYLVNLNDFKIDSKLLQRGILQDCQILLPHEPGLIKCIMNLHERYPNNDTFIYIEPYRFYVKAAELHGLNLEQALEKHLSSNQNIRSLFLVYNEKTGEELAKIDFELTQKKDHKRLFCERLLPDWRISRCIHTTISANIINHIDGSKKSYTKKSYSSRLSKNWNFNKNVDTKKGFRIDGKLPLSELDYISKAFFNFSTPYFKMTRLPEPPWSKAKRKLRALSCKFSPKD